MNTLSLNPLQKQKENLVKKAYKKILKQLDLLEGSLLRGRTEKRHYQQRKRISSSIHETKSYQQLIQDIYAI